MQDQQVDTQSKTRLTFYKGFLEEEWYWLPQLVQEELASFLRDLKSNPNEPYIHSRCETDQLGRLAYGLPDGYWVFLRIKTESDGHYIGLLEGESVRINVLEVCRISSF